MIVIGILLIIIIVELFVVINLLRKPKFNRINIEAPEGFIKATLKSQGDI